MLAPLVTGGLLGQGIVLGGYITGSPALVSFVDPLAVARDSVAQDAIFGAGIDPLAVSQDATKENATFGAGINPVAVARDAIDEDEAFGVGIDPFAVNH